MYWRHLLSILLLPFLVVVIVPYGLLTAVGHENDLWRDHLLIVWVARLVGGLVILAGLMLFTWCVSLFARVGQGTLAPWDPTRKLVAVGPYRFTRNPMITAVALLLMGQAILWRSWSIGLWALVFILINHIYFIFSEEPGLEARFGESYRVYKAHVPRWIPRLRPWLGE